MEFNTFGNKIGNISVKINYRIIELFSAGLYSSPNKAFEELVSNAYDANASKVSIYLPEQIKQNSMMIVCDNGSSMDSAELHQLWKIGSSKKRESESSDRPPIGQFGIGKLATFVLATRLTYICKKNSEIRLVTMDYGDLKKDYGEQSIKLDERLIDEEDAQKKIEDLFEKNTLPKISFELFGEKSEKTWTIAIMSNLKEDSKKIKIGRLDWILRTALPLSPQFYLELNGEKVKSSKINGTIWKTWIIGSKSDHIINREDEYSRHESEGINYLDLPNLKNVHGFIELYENSLVKGKSRDLGRSNGIFLMIRGRLININNPLLDGIKELNHAVFNRIRIVIHADELDKQLTSGRESIIESTEYSELQKYIKQKFNRVKSYFDKVIGDKEKEISAAYKISKTSSRYSRTPIIETVKKYYKKEILEPYTIRVPLFSGDERIEFLEELEKEAIKDSDDFIKDVELSGELDSQDPIVILDVKERKLKVNMLHPFFINFSYNFKSSLPYKLIAATEVLTEAKLIELGIDSVKVRTIMMERDAILREYAYDENPNAPAVAHMIKNALDDSEGLEIAVFYGFKSLGFNTTKIGGNGTPDGKASALRGICPTLHKRIDYTVTYDAKSTKGEKIAAATIKASACVRHRKDYGANYSAVIAIDFEGANDPDSAANKEAVQQKVSLIRAKDFWKLVLLAIPKQLNYDTLKDFFETCYTVIDTEKWIENFSKSNIEKMPILEILKTIEIVMEKDKRETPDVSSLRRESKILNEYSKEEVISMIKAINLIVPRLIYIDDELRVRLLTNSETVLNTIEDVVDKQVPKEFIDFFEKAFDPDKPN